MIIKCPHCHAKNRVPTNRLVNSPGCGVCHKKLFSLPINVDRNNFQEIVNQDQLPILIDFWAPWCGPCKSFASTFTASASRYVDKVIYAKVNTEDEVSLAQHFNIQSIPTLIGFKNGSEFHRLSGALTLSQLIDFTNSLLN